jgi:hypothetical protein
MKVTVAIVLLALAVFCAILGLVREDKVPPKFAVLLVTLFLVLERLLYLLPER